VRRAVDAIALRRVRSHLKAAGIDPAKSICVISNVYAIHVATGLGFGTLVYDCNDAHADFPGLPTWTRDYQAETLRHAGAVIVSSRGLLSAAESARSSQKGVHSVGNGVDFALFQTAIDAAVPIPSDVVRVGYVGAVAPWFDFELVTAMARAHPTWQFVMVGPVLGGVAQQVEGLARLPNVVLGDAIPHDAVPGVLARFTVGMIPFRRNALTAGVNPNKLYEYLAAGLPVVATPFSPDVDAVDGVIALASDADAFATACEALTRARRDPARAAAMQSGAAEIARAHDWDAIAASFWTHVAQAARSS
jgi:glycosyltransferase involved in cell wall biosynthesis